MQTPAVRDVVTTGRRLAHMNRSAHYGRSGLIVSGPARTGKTTAITQLGKTIEVFHRRRYQHVLDCWRLRVDVYARLNDLTPGDAQILPLQIGTPQSRRELHPVGRGAAVVGRAHCDLPGLVSP